MWPIITSTAVTSTALATCLVAASALASQNGPAASGWAPPLPGAWQRILQPFERPVDRFGQGHRGVDLPARPAQEVLAIGSGVVSFVGDVAGTPAITVDHRVVRSSYLPVEAVVEVGDRVQAGQVIGTIHPSAQHCPRTCLHLGVRRPAWEARDALADPYLDPVAWITRIPVLKPVDRSPA